MITVEDLLSYEGYYLVFEDRFDGTELDRSHWNVELHEPGWVNEELQRYVDCRTISASETGSC